MKSKYIKPKEDRSDVSIRKINSDNEINKTISI